MDAILKQLTPDAKDKHEVLNNKLRPFLAELSEREPLERDDIDQLLFGNDDSDNSLNDPDADDFRGLFVLAQAQSQAGGGFLGTGSKIKRSATAALSIIHSMAMEPQFLLPAERALVQNTFRASLDLRMMQMLNLGKHLKAWALEYADGPWVWEEIGDRSVYGVRKNKHFSTPEALELLILLRELQNQLPMSKYLTKDDYVHLANRLIRQREEAEEELSEIDDVDYSDEDSEQKEPSRASKDLRRVADSVVEKVPAEIVVNDIGLDFDQLYNPEKEADVSMEHIRPSQIDGHAPKNPSAWADVDVEQDRQYFKQPDKSAQALVPQARLSAGGVLNAYTDPLSGEHLSAFEVQAKLGEHVSGMEDLLPLMATSPNFNPKRYLQIVQRDATLRQFNQDYLKLRQRLKKPNAGKAEVVRAHFDTFISAQQSLTRLNRYLENQHQLDSNLLFGRHFQSLMASYRQMQRLADSTLSEWQRQAEELRILIELGSDEQWIATVDEVILTAADLGTWVGGLDKEGKLIAQLKSSQEVFENFKLEKQGKLEGPDKKTAEQVTTICQQIIGTLKLRIEAQLVDFDLDQNNWLTPHEIKVRASELQKTISLLNQFDDIESLSFVKMVTNRAAQILDLALRQDASQSMQIDYSIRSEVDVRQMTLGSGHRSTVVKEMRLLEQREQRRFDIVRARTEVVALMKALESVGQKLRVPDAVVDLISALFDPLEVVIGDVEIQPLSEHFLDDNSQDRLSDENILALIELEKMLCGEPNVPQALVYHAFDRLIEQLKLVQVQPKYTLVCFHERLLNVPDLVVLSLDVIKSTFKKFDIDSRHRVVRACYANFIEQLTDKVLESTETIELQVWAYAVVKAFLPDEFASLYLEDTPILLSVEMQERLQDFCNKLLTQLQADQEDADILLKIIQ